MTATDLVLNFLQKEGFCPKKEEYGIVFKYQMKHFIFFNNDNDEEFFQLVMPGVFDVDEENIVLALRACSKMNEDVKVVKAFISEKTEDIWLAFEIILDQNPEVDSILPRALNSLLHAQNVYYQSLRDLAAE